MKFTESAKIWSSFALGSVSALWAVADAEVPRAHALCTARGVGVEIVSGSRLRSGAGERMDLQRGWSVECQTPRARAVLARIDEAVQLPWLRRLQQPIIVHLDPQLPPGQAKIRGIEVHATSREILVATERLAELGAGVWRHELFHTLASPLPLGSRVARRVALTLEEGLVQHATRLAGNPGDVEASACSGWVDPECAEWEQLALPAYDPHPLAAGLACELSRAEPPLDAVGSLDCLQRSATSAEVHSLETIRESVRWFTSGCSPAGERALVHAIQRWLPESLPFWPTLASKEAAAGLGNR
jgi:hypothetical protein